MVPTASTVPTHTDRRYSTVDRGQPGRDTAGRGREAPAVQRLRGGVQEALPE